MDLDKKLVDLFNKAVDDPQGDLGQVPDKVSTDILPKEVSDKIIEDITEANIMRRLFTTIKVAGRSLTLPIVRSGDAINVYKIGHGVKLNDAGREQISFGTDAVVFEPKLLASYVVVTEDDLETASIDVGQYIRREIARKLAEAEEKMILFGVKNDADTSYLSVADGLYTIASDAGKCATTPVTYTSSDDLVDKISDAVKALGAYGEDRPQLALIVSSTFGNNLRKTDKLINTRYVPDTDVVKTGTLPPVAGVKVFETAYLDAKESGEVALLVRKDAPIIGDKKRIQFRKKSIEEKFSVMLIAAEQVDFKYARLDVNSKALGLVLIHKSTT